MVSPFAQKPLTAELMMSLRKQVREQAEAQRRDSFQQFMDFYIGAPATLTDSYAKQHYREQDDAWLGRKSRLRGINICQPVVQKIVDSVYGGTVQRHVKKRGRKDTSKKQDPWLQTMMQDADYPGVIMERIRDASIYGTQILGPCWNGPAGQIGFQTRYIGEVYPHVSQNDAHELLGLNIEYDVDDPFADDGRGMKYTKLECYTPDEIGFYWTQDTSRLYWEPMPIALLGDMPSNPMVNPYGMVLWEALRAEIDPDPTYWWGLSDLTDIKAINQFINSLLSIVDKNAHDQGWSQLVLENFPDDITKINVGSAKAVKTGEGGSAYFISPDLKINEWLALIEKIYTYALEGKCIPKAALRTSSEPRSGVSLELSLRPLIDMSLRRRRRYRRNEGRLLKMSMLVNEVHENNRVFTPTEAAAFMRDWEVTVEWGEDLMPHDVDKEIDRDVKLVDAGLKDPVDLVEKYNELKGQSPEDKWKGIRARLAEVRKEDAQTEATTGSSQQ